MRASKLLGAVLRTFHVLTHVIQERELHLCGFLCSSSYRTAKLTPEQRQSDSSGDVILDAL